MKEVLLRCVVILLGIVPVMVASADVDLIPRSGVEMNAILGTVAQESVVLNPDSSQTSAVRYRLQSLSSGNNTIDNSRLKVNTIYTVGAESLDIFRTFLSGDEDGQQVIATFEFQPGWEDIPGTYTGRVISASSVPEIPVKVTVPAKSLMSLNPPMFSITPSQISSPIITDVNVMMGSNSQRWELFLVAGDLAREGGEEEIKTDRVFVRVKNELDPQPWLSINEPTMVASGTAGSMRSIVTLQFIVESVRTDAAGKYTGNIRFLVRNM